MISAEDALERLREGNRRFVSDEVSDETLASREHRAGAATPQHPFAIILACSDSRVPTELIFDRGIGDLFVIRVAGNIVAPSQIGSIEFAAKQFNTRLVVVLGQSNSIPGWSSSWDTATAAPSSRHCRKWRSRTLTARRTCVPLLIVFARLWSPSWRMTVTLTTKP